MRVDDARIAEVLNEMQGSCIQDRNVNKFIADLLADRATMLAELAHLRTMLEEAKR